MKQKYVLSLIGLGAVGLIMGAKRQKNGTKADFRENSVFHNAGVPDQYTKDDLAQLENAKMVSEGSQFGVQYYTNINEKGL